MYSNYKACNFLYKERVPLPKLTFNQSDLSATTDILSLAHNFGMMAGVLVKVTKVTKGSEDGSCADTSAYLGKVGTLERITVDGCSMRFDDDDIAALTGMHPKALHVMTKDELKEYKSDTRAAKKQKTSDASNVVLPDGLPYVLSETSHTSKSLIGWAQAALWKLVVSSATGPSGLILKYEDENEGQAVICAKDFSATSLCIIPFGNVAEKVFAKTLKNHMAIPLKVSFEIDKDTTMEKDFYIQGFEASGGDPMSDPPVPPARSPFWFLNGVIGQDSSTNLVEITHKFESTLGVSANATKKAECADCMKKSSPAVKVTLELPILTNQNDVSKGTRLYFSEVDDDE